MKYVPVKKIIYIYKIPDISLFGPNNTKSNVSALCSVCFICPHKMINEMKAIQMHNTTKPNTAHE